MRTAKMLCAAVASALSILSARGQSPSSVPVALEVANSEGLARAGLAWTADPGVFYEIYTTTNLASGAWELAVAEPVSSTNLVAQMEILSADKTRFFQVRPLDTRGPSITARYPGSGSANIGVAEPLSITVSDPSGVDINTIRVSINGAAPLSPGAAGVSVTANGFSYDPAQAGTDWGVYGSTVTVTFACADLKGNSTFEDWPFYLESPLTVSDNVIVLGETPAQSYAVVRPLPALAGAPVPRTPVTRPLESGLAIVSIHPDRITVSYTGETHGLPIGAFLANNDYDNIFYRQVTGFADNPAAKQVVVYTEDVPFTHLITEGSFDSRDFIVIESQSLSALDLAPLDPLELTKKYEKSGTYSVIRDWGPVAFNGSAGYTLAGGMDFSTLVEGLKVKHLTAGVYATFNLTLGGNLVFDAATEPLDTSMAIIDDLRLVRIAGSIYGIPVVVYLYLDLDLCVEAESSGAVTLTSGAVFDASFTNRVTFSGGTWRREPERDAFLFDCDIQTPALSGGMEGEVFVYLKPTLTLRLYNAVGVGLDYRRGPLVTGAYSAPEGRYHFALYDRRSVNLSLWCTDLPTFLDGVIDPDNLPEWNLWTAPNDLRFSWYWPEIPPSAPAFTLHPSGGTFASGAPVTLTASASGNPAPAYQWYQNGALLPGRTASTLSLAMGASAVGSYHCRASNSRGAANSQSAALSLPASAPAGMALIPAGSFQMGDNLGDGWSAEVSVHTVYVSAFHMDKTEVTWGKWKEVRTYAAANGYDIGSVGSGKADNHPVHSVNWYDCVKWLNARSQMEGLTPCYTRGGAVYKAEEHDDIVCNWSANGYRLPTEAEWEKAARGGLSGRRFPWGDTIQHSRANYYASLWDWYDTNGYEGHHPSYSAGGYPYTSPVGAFAANGYGLHDMAGNVLEWCWDWFAYYPSGSASNPRGPSEGSPRVLRGGGWDYGAGACRVAFRHGHWPVYRYDDIGFRAVCPPGQQ